MAPVTKHAILKKLETLYRSVFHDGKWHIALQMAEWHGKNRGMFEAPCLSETTRIAGIMEQRRQDLADVQERLDPELTHPPPPVQARERSVKNPFIYNRLLSQPRILVQG